MRNINPFGLRLQPDLKARLEEAAATNKRSLNAEITARLEASFQPRSIMNADPISLTTSTGKQIHFTPDKLLTAASQQIERLAFSVSQLEDATRRLAQLEAERAQNSLDMVDAAELRKEELRLRQMQITSEAAALKMQIYMLEHEIRSSESALGLRVAIPGLEGFDPGDSE